MSVLLFRLYFNFFSSFRLGAQGGFSQNKALISFQVFGKLIFEWAKVEDTFFNMLNCTFEVVLGIEYTYCTGGMCYRSDVGSSCLNLRSGGIKRSDIQTGPCKLID